MKNYGIFLFFIVIVTMVIFIIYNFLNTGTDTSNTTDIPVANMQEMKKIKLNEVTHSVFYAPQYVAINNGYFEEQGIEIELINGQGADKVMTAVLSGQSDIGFCGPEASIYIYNEGREDYAEVFAQLTQRDGSFLVGREPNNDFKWSDLKGKSILPGRKGGVPYMTFEYVLKQNGLTPNVDVTLDNSVAFEVMAGAYTGGKADYVTLFEPTCSLLEAEEKGYIVASVGEASGEIPYTAYFASKSFIDENPDTIRKFVKAIYKGQQFVQNSTPEAIAEVIAPSFPDTDTKVLESVVKRYKDIDAYAENPVLKEESFNLLQEVMTEAGELKKKAPYNIIVNNKFAEEVIK